MGWPKPLLFCKVGPFPYINYEKEDKYVKAIHIDKANQRRLEGDYELEEGELDDKLGLFLVTDFGEGIQIEGYITKDVLVETYILTSAIINNGWIEIVAKPKEE